MCNHNCGHVAIIYYVHHRFSALVFVDVVLVVLSLLLGISTGGVISAGLASTCSAFKDVHEDDDVP